MILNTGIWVIFCLCGLATGYCLYGDTPDCAFQCHCAVDSERSEGVCPSGCDSGPLGYDWGGPACQIGNVGLGKPANETTEDEDLYLYPGTAALDGVRPNVFGSNCAYLDHPDKKPAEWWTDLGDIYKICNITIYGRTDDCSHCPVRVTCNDVTGCTECNGFYPPDCTQKCESGYYGANCQEQCGHCKDEVTCENENGRCSNGCQLWWADNRCQTYVENPDGTGKKISVRREGISSIEIEWQHFSNISDELKPYYGYLIEYKADRTGGNYTEAGTINYTSSPYWKIEKLRSDTNYSIQIKPFRIFGDHKDYGSAYPELQAMTRSADPPERNGTSQTSFSLLYMTVAIIVIFLSLNIFLGNREGNKQS